MTDKTFPVFPTMQTQCTAFAHSQLQSDLRSCIHLATGPVKQEGETVKSQHMKGLLLPAVW